MGFWIFKVASQELYPDVKGLKYVYDNTHSVRVAQGDYFLYLDKAHGYAFTATGVVKTVTERAPLAPEVARSSKVKKVFTAHLQEVLWFNKVLSVSPRTAEGRCNRALLGIEDVNLLGWSQSIPAISECMYNSIMDLAEIRGQLPAAPLHEPVQDYSVPDSWSLVKVRRKMLRFSSAVMGRSEGKCVICGTAAHGLLEAAHLTPYANDISNRANPGNGICLCKFCHRAFDLRIVAIGTDGSILTNDLSDEVAAYHFSRVTQAQRLKWLRGVDLALLAQTVDWFARAKENESENDRG